RELTNLVESALDFWLTAGPYGQSFEKEMRKFFGAADFLLVNSGSSANLVMVSALTSPMVAGRLEPGDEVITPAVTFPTTLTPIVQNGLVPVFVDCELGTYNVDPAAVEAAIGPRTRVLMLPHTLGNPFDLGRRLRSQVHLLQSRLQPEGHRHAGRHRAGPAREGARLLCAPPGELPASVRGPATLRGPPAAAALAAGGRSRLVRLPGHRARW